MHITYIMLAIISYHRRSSSTEVFLMVLVRGAHLDVYQSWGIENSCRGLDFGGNKKNISRCIIPTHGLKSLKI